MDRIEDEHLRKFYSSQRCCLCNNPPPNDGHHIKSRGSWGHDIDDNLLTLCRNHHQMIHAYGINKMLEVFPRLRPILLSKGWYCQDFGEGRNRVRKWFNEKVRL